MTSSPIGLVFLFVAVVSTLALPKKYAFVPLLATACFIPLGERLIIGGFNLYFFRIVLLVGAVRVVLRSEFRLVRPMALDFLFLGWVFVPVAVATFLDLSFGNLKSQLGKPLNVLGTYLFLRCIITDRDDAIRSIRVLVVLAIPLAAMMVVEHLTRENVLSFLSGARQTSAMRDGSARAQAAFSHSILAGTFGATLFPLAAAIWTEGRLRRRWAVAAVVAPFMIVLSTVSTGPLVILIGGIGAVALWRLRTHVRMIRWAALLGLLLLAFWMTAPVWHISGYLGEALGGTGWHRANLIDAWIAHFNEWWLAGTDYTVHWSSTGKSLPGNPDMMDITNHYIGESVRGGLSKLVLFLAILATCFRMIGRRVSVSSTDNPRAGFLAWCLGASLLVHCVAFLNVSYFDQSIVFWTWLVALIAVVGLPSSRTVDHTRYDPEYDTQPCLPRDRHLTTSAQNYLSPPNSPIAPRFASLRVGYLES